MSRTCFLIRRTLRWGHRCCFLSIKKSNTFERGCAQTSSRKFIFRSGRCAEEREVWVCQTELSLEKVLDFWWSSYVIYCILHSYLTSKKYRRILLSVLGGVLVSCVISITEANTNLRFVFDLQKTPTKGVYLFFGIHLDIEISKNLWKNTH